MNERVFSRTLSDDEKEVIFRVFLKWKRVRNCSYPPAAADALMFVAREMEDFLDDALKIGESDDSGEAA